MFDCSFQYRGQEVYEVNKEYQFLDKYILVLGGLVAVELLADDDNLSMNKESLWAFREECQ